MSRLAKITIGLGVSLVVILIAGFLLVRHLITKSFPVTDGTIRVTGLHAPVDVYRDEYGVPHIKAQDEHDLMFAVGYVHAQDRLWQMDMTRRAGEGRLSEVFGSATVNYDRLFRTLNLHGVVERMKQQLHAESYRLLEAYTEGVNAFIEMHQGGTFPLERKYPIEFDILDYEPEPWTIEHSLLAARLIAWELNLAWWADVAYGEIAMRVSPEKLKEILPGYPDSVQVTVPSNLPKRDVAALRDLLTINASYREFFGLGSLAAGSNAWVVDSSKSLSGKPLLANDPHLPMPQPSRWYEAHLSAPGWNVAGVTIPGAPVVIVGHNDRIAWGLTNAMIDDADFFVEQADSTDPNRYIVRSRSLPMEVRTETIYIQDNDSINITVRSTLHGPIVSDVHPGYTRQPDSVKPRPIIAMRWTGLDVSDELYGFYLMNTATSPREFERGVKEITVPGQAVVYADVSGNIAYWTTGRVPIRGGGENPLVPLSGWTGEDEWRGFVPFEQLPKLMNPAEGFIACANQRIADRSYPYFLSTLWEPPSRIQRIRELLRSSEKFTADDFKQFQQDIVSLYARDVTNYLHQAFENVSVDDSSIADALTYIQNWDYRFTTSDIATTIFNAFFLKLLHNTYADEMGDELFADFVFFGAIPYRVTAQLLSADSSAWFDDVRTEQVESRSDILRKSFTEAVGELQDRLGREKKTWQWGTQHTVTFKHVFGSRKPLDRVFNVGPFPVPGGGTTINKSEYRITSPYATAVGPSMRQVIDLAQPLDAFTVITTGQSGQPLQKHYDDQTSLWLNGGYRRVTMDWNAITKSRWDHLVLKP